MSKYILKRWQTYWKTKSWFSKVTDLLFILLLVGMLIPASRKEISAFMAGLMAGSPKTIESSEQQSLGSQDWTWQLADISGNQVTLEQFKGKTIFLNFWATWCPPCIAEMPDIQELYDGYGDKAVFLLVSDEAPQTIKAFMEKKGYRMPVYQQQSSIPQVFATNSIPTTWVIDQNGKIIIRKTGAAKWNSEAMQKTMQSLWESQQ